MATKTQLKKSLEKAISIIRSGTKKGVDNLELSLSAEERKALSPLMNILNDAEIEYRQGNGARIESIESMLLNAYRRNDYGINLLKVKADEISEVLGYYRYASAMLEEKQRGKSVSKKNSFVHPSYKGMVSCNDYRTFEQLKEARDKIRKNKGNVDIVAVADLKDKCAKKYAQTSGECMWIIDTYARQ